MCAHPIAGIAAALASSSSYRDERLSLVRHWLSTNPGRSASLTGAEIEERRTADGLRKMRWQFLAGELSNEQVVEALDLISARAPWRQRGRCSVLATSCSWEKTYARFKGWVAAHDGMMPRLREDE